MLAEAEENSASILCWNRNTMTEIYTFVYIILLSNSQDNFFQGQNRFKDLLFFPQTELAFYTKIV